MSEKLMITATWTDKHNPQPLSYVDCLDVYEFLDAVLRHLPAVTALLDAAAFFSSPDR